MAVKVGVEPTIRDLRWPVPVLIGYTNLTQHNNKIFAIFLKPLLVHWPLSLSVGSLSTERSVLSTAKLADRERFELSTPFSDILP